MDEDSVTVGGYIVHVSTGFYFFVHVLGPTTSLVPGVMGLVVWTWDRSCGVNGGRFGRFEAAILRSLSLRTRISSHRTDRLGTGKFHRTPEDNIFKIS